MGIVQEETRKGPWTEQEDFRLVCYVGLFGDRRWDSIAKLSGLQGGGRHVRTGKSCRLRWVNYLHPGLKRGKLSQQEENVVVELHSKWGNRWSKIARKLPGRTDNEIKNFWRSYTRKKAKEKKRVVTLSSSSSNSSLSESTNPTVDSLQSPKTGEESFYGPDNSALTEKKAEVDQEEGKEYSMDDIWKDLSLTEESITQAVCDVYGEEVQNLPCPPVASLSWDCFQDFSWKMDEEGSKMVLTTSDPFLYCYEYGKPLAGRSGFD